MADAFTMQAAGLQEFVARFGRIPDAVRAKLQGGMMEVGQAVTDAAKARAAMLFANGGGSIAESIGWHTESTDEQEVAVIRAEGLPYLAIQEFGGVTSPHDIFPVNAAVLAFMSPASLGFSSGAVGNDMVFAKAVHHPGSRMPERSYMRSGLHDSRAQIIAILTEATAIGAGQA